MQTIPLTDPRNASELHFLVHAAPGAPTLLARREALQFLHAKGQTMDDSMATERSRAAWAAFKPTSTGAPS